jgi:hypothetical protein
MRRTGSDVICSPPEHLESVELVRGQVVFCFELDGILQHGWRNEGGVWRGVGLE